MQKGGGLCKEAQKWAIKVREGVQFLGSAAGGRVIKHGFAFLHTYKVMLKSLKIGKITNHRICAKKLKTKSQIGGK